VTWEQKWLWHVLATAACVVIFLGSLLSMWAVWDSALVGVAGPGVPLSDRVVTGLSKNLSARMMTVGTILCLVNASAQYGVRWVIRIIRDGGRETPPLGLSVMLAARSWKIAESVYHEGHETPRPGFSLVRAAQSVLLAWVLWWSFVVWLSLG
jgi:hypothetical protein